MITDPLTQSLITSHHWALAGRQVGGHLLCEQDTIPWFYEPSCPGWTWPFLSGADRERNLLPTGFTLWRRRFWRYNIYSLLKRCYFLFLFFSPRWVEYQVIDVFSSSKLISQILEKAIMVERKMNIFDFCISYSYCWGPGIESFISQRTSSPLQVQES